VSGLSVVEPVDGIYAIYLTAKDGKGLIVAAITQGKIAGADTECGTLVGTYSFDTRNKTYEIDAQLSFSADGSLIQGADIKKGFSYSVAFSLPQNFTLIDYFKIDTPFGPVNAKFRFLTSLGAAQEAA
jgi:hypothetical protein